MFTNSEHMANIVLSVSKSHELYGENEIIEFNATGDLLQNGQEYTLSYLEDNIIGDYTHTAITVSGKNAVVLKKMGYENSEILLETKKPFSTIFQTASGPVDMHIFPTFVQTEIDDNSGKIEWEYIMSIDGTQVVNKFLLSYIKEKNILNR